MAVALIVLGVVYAYQRPSADQLYSTITANEKNPQLARDEIQQFLEDYPDHEKADQVRSLSSLANAIALKQRLTVQSDSRMGNQLTEIENQFVEIMELSRKDVPTAYSRLNALVTLYEGDKSLKPEDAACIAAAKVFSKQLKNEAKNQQLDGRKRIESLMKRAQASPAAEAAKLYRSIIELYGESSWAKPLIDKVNQRLEKIEQE